VEFGHGQSQDYTPSNAAVMGEIMNNKGSVRKRTSSNGSAIPEFECGD
jgi:hypothetical protein